MDESGQRRQRSVAYYWPGAREALIVEPLRGTPLPVQATPFSRRFPWSHSQVSDILRRDACIPSTLAWRTSPRINLFQRILLIGDGSAARTAFGCYLFRIAYKLARIRPILSSFNDLGCCKVHRESDAYKRRHQMSDHGCRIP